MNSGEDEATRRHVEELTEYVFRYLQRAEQNDPEPDTENGIRERSANLVNYALEKWNAGERVHRGGIIVLRGALNIQSEEDGAVVDWIYDAVDRDLASHRMTWYADCPSPDTETDVRGIGQVSGPALMFDEEAFNQALAERTQRIMASVYRKRKIGRVLPFLGRLNREETTIVRGALRHAFAENHVVVRWLVDMVEDGMHRYGMTWED